MRLPDAVDPAVVVSGVASIDPSLGSGGTPAVQERDLSSSTRTQRRYRWVHVLAPCVLCLFEIS